MRDYVIKALRNYGYRFLEIRAVATLLANRLATAYFVRMCARVKTP